MGLPKHEGGQCGRVKGRAGFSPSMWHNKADKEREVQCLECEAKTTTLVCDICSLTKPENAFAISALHNRALKTRKTRCHDCSHPPCIFLLSCTSCAKCRNPTCRTKICSKAIEPLPSMELPASAEKVQTFECKRCKYVRCIVVQPDGTRCGRERRHNAQAQAKRLHNDYKCGACLQ